LKPSTNASENVGTSTSATQQRAIIPNNKKNTIPEEEEEEIQILQIPPKT
jgi:hypothetical protein